MGEHYYTRAGEPRHWLIGKNGKERATTLADAKRELLVPSFSTVDNIRAKYALTRHLIREAARTAYGFEPGNYGDPDSYADAVLAHLDETKGERTGSEVGTLIHDSIESVCNGGEPMPGYEAHTEAALNEVARLFPDVTDWISEQTFANPMGYGGMCDLHSPSTGITIDYKSKDFWLGLAGDTTTPTRLDGRPYRLDYDQYIQLATYSRGLMLPRNVAANVFISREQPGSAWSRVWTLDELAKGWDMFQHCFGMWVLDKEYDPSWIPGEEAAA